MTGTLPRSERFGGFFLSCIPLTESLSLRLSCDIITPNLWKKRRGFEHEHMHHLPREMVAEPGSQPATAFDGREQDDVEHWEEDGEVASGSNP